MRWGVRLRPIDTPGGWDAEEGNPPNGAVCPDRPRQERAASLTNRFSPLEGGPILQRVHRNSQKMPVT